MADFMMPRKCFISLFLLFIGMSPCQTCRPDLVRSCTGYELIAKPDFNVYMPPDRISAICSALEATLDCAYHPDRLGPCSDDPRFAAFSLAFDTQKGVIEALCKTRREDYRRSAHCFNQRNLRDAIRIRCLSVLNKKNPKDYCNEVTRVPECAREVTMMVDGCSSTDAQFMKELVNIYVRPSVKLLGCSNTKEVDEPMTSSLMLSNTTTQADNQPSVGDTKDDDVSDEPSSADVFKESPPTSTSSDLESETTSALEKSYGYPGKVMALASASRSSENKSSSSSKSSKTKKTSSSYKKTTSSYKKVTDPPSKYTKSATTPSGSKTMKTTTKTKGKTDGKKSGSSKGESGSSGSKNGGHGTIGEAGSQAAGDHPGNGVMPSVSSKAITGTFLTTVIISAVYPLWNH